MLNLPKIHTVRKHFLKEVLYKKTFFLKKVTPLHGTQPAPNGYSSKLSPPLARSNELWRTELKLNNEGKNTARRRSQARVKQVRLSEARSRGNHHNTCVLSPCWKLQTLSILGTLNSTLNGKSCLAKDGLLMFGIFFWISLRQVLQKCKSPRITYCGNGGEEGVFLSRFTPIPARVGWNLKYVSSRWRHVFHFRLAWGSGGGVSLW